MNLPAATEDYVIHRRPMLLVRRLLCVDGDYGEAETVLEPGDACIGPDGRVEPAAMVELVAQTYAAAQGYRDSEAGKTPSKGYLVGAGNFVIEDIPSAGELLRITVNSTCAFEDFYMVDGQVLRGDQKIASGTLKAWVQSKDEPQDNT